MRVVLSETPGAHHRASNRLLSGFDQLPDSAHVPIHTVCALYGCSPATAWRRVRTGHIVQPVKFGARSTRWCVGDLRRSLMAVSSAKGAK